MATAEGHGAFQKAHLVELPTATDDDDDISEILRMLEVDAESERRIESEDSVGRPFKWHYIQVYQGMEPEAEDSWSSPNTNQEAIIEIIRNHASLALKQFDRFKEKVGLIRFYESRVKAKNEILGMMRRAWFLLNAFKQFSAQLDELHTQVELAIVMLSRSDIVDLKPPAYIEQED